MVCCMGVGQEETVRIGFYNILSLVRNRQSRSRVQSECRKKMEQAWLITRDSLHSVLTELSSILISSKINGS